MARTPLQGGECSGNSQTRRPVSSSSARIIERERRQRDAVARAVVGNLDVLAHDPRARVERQEPRVERSDEDRVIEDRCPAVDPAEAEVPDILNQRPLEPRAIPKHACPAGFGEPQRHQSRRPDRHVRGC